MADLFTDDECNAYLQTDDIPAATIALVRSLVTAEIRLQAGPTVYDGLTSTDLLAFKAIALAATRRAVLNPSGLRSTQIDDYAETWAVETLGDVELTVAERARIDTILGRSADAFTIRPAGCPDSHRNPFLPGIPAYPFEGARCG